MAQATSHPQSLARSRETSGQAASLLALQRAYGNRLVQRWLDQAVVQTRLEISRPDDVYEQEADRVADQVMRMPDSAVNAIGQTPLLNIQRLCSGCEENLHRQMEEDEGLGSFEHLVDDNLPLPDEMIESPSPFAARYALVQRMCTSCEEEENVRKKEIPGQSSATGFEPIQNGGQPLDTGVRSFFEPRFGYSFDQVRIHTDGQAAESARAVSALAYTVGNNVVFGAGQYKPDTTDGRRLIAHELTHVVQQKAARILTKSSAPPSNPIQIQPGLSNTIIQRWHVDGDADSTKNTIVCDGKGGVAVQLGGTGTAQQAACLKDCMQKHEESHKEDALAADANICKDKDANKQIVFNGEQKASETKASNAEISCLNDKLSKAGDDCKEIIKKRIKQMEEYRDKFK